MAAPLKIAATVTIDPSQAKAGAKEAVTSIDGIGASATSASTKLQRLIETSVGIGGGAANSNIREWSGALAMAGRSADELRAKYNPLFAVIAQYKQNLIEIRTLTAQGVLTTDEMTSAIQRQRQATLASIDAIKGRNAAMHGSGGTNMATTNAMFQFQDIAMTSAMGMNPLMVGLQQGSQLAGGFAGMSIKEAAAATLGGLTSLVSPLSLVTVGLTAATAAGIQFFSSLSTSAKSASDVISAQAEHVKSLAEAYGIATDKAMKFSDAQRAIAKAQTEKGLTDTLEAQKKAAQDLIARFGVARSSTATYAGSQFATPEYSAASNFKVFEPALQQLNDGIKTGKINAEAFITTVNRISEANPRYAAFGQQILTAADDLLKLNKEAEKTVDILAQIASQGSRLDPLGVFDPSKQQQRIADLTPSKTLQLQQQLAALQLTADAKSAAEKAAAARATAAAQFNPGESSTDRANRIELAGQQALITAEKELTEAKRDRLRSIDQTLESARLELTLIGQTTSSMEAQRMELRLLTEAKTAAEKAGTTVSQDEIERIKQAAAEYGRLQEAIKATNILRDQSNSIEQLRLEISLIGQSEATRTRALALAEAEQRIRDQGISTNSQAAQAIRANASAMAEEASKLNRLQDAWNTVQSAGEDAIDRIGEAIRTGDWAGAVEGILADIQKSFITLGVTNPLKNALFGTNYGTLSDAGGLIGKLFGGSGVTTAAASAVGAMNVSAGTVIVNGGIGGGSLSPSNLLSGIGSAANQNLTGTMAQYAAAIRQIESGGDYSKLGPLLANGDQALGGYQVMRSNLASWTQGALGRSLSQSEFLSSPAAQDAVFAKYFGSSLSKFGNPQDAASVWFTGRPMATGAGASDVLGTTGAQYVQKFNTALGQVTNTAGQFGSSINSAGSGLNSLASGLNSMGSGLSDFGKSLTSYFPSAPSSSGGGIGSLFSKLFGSIFVPNGAQATAAASGSIFGLFDDGGYTGPGGKYEPAGLVHRGEIVWSQDDIARAGGVGIVEFARRRGLKGYADGGVVYDNGPVYGKKSPAVSNGSDGRTSIVINNYSAARVTTEETQDDKGNRQTVFTIADAVGDALSRKGGGAKKTLASDFGVRQKGRAR